MTDTKPVPTADEMLPIVRNRLHALEEAVEAFLTVMKETGSEREAAYRLVNRIDQSGTVATFLDVYESTFAPRLEAFTKLHEAMTTDFKTALICAPDTTDEHLAQWLPKLAPTEPEKDTRNPSTIYDDEM